VREGWLAAYQAGALLALTVLAFALRVQVLFASGRLGADEAIVGLMARHILEGERPVFYRGQSYLRGHFDSRCRPDLPPGHGNQRCLRF